MIYLVSTLLAIVLFAGFILLTYMEQRRGVRYFAHSREALDKRVGRLEFIAEHVDFAAFLRDNVKAVGERIVHDTAHGSLVAVRFVERLLTRAVRSLRERRAENAIANDEQKAEGPEAVSFASSMKDFSTALRDERRAGEEQDTNS
jgi:hypothetical protein